MPIFMGERRDKVPKFWDWMDASEDTEQRAVLVLSEDFLFYDLMRGYSGLAARYLTVTLPTAVFTGVVSPLILLAVDAIRSCTAPKQGL